MAKASAGKTVTDLIADLKSDDPSLRRNARDALVLTGLPSIKPMMTELRNNPSDYRLRGGVVFVLSTLLKLNPNQKEEFSKELNNEDFAVLVPTASDDDKTVRLQAAEFLFILGDPRAVEFSVEAARATQDTQKAANQISIIGQSSQRLATDQKTRLLMILLKVQDQTTRLSGMQVCLNKDWDSKLILKSSNGPGQIKRL